MNGLSSPLAPALTIPSGEALFPGQLETAESARRTAPEAIYARQASSSAYEALDAHSAAKLAGERFPALVGESDAVLSHLPSGATVSGILNDFSASIDFGGGKHGVVQSVGPLAVQGGRAPVDLTLREAGGGFTPRRAAAPLRIPARLSEGVALSDSGVSLTPVSPSGAALVSAGGFIEGATVFYGDSEDPGAGIVDLDTLVKPQTAGFSEETVLRSERSPSKLYFKVGLPAGGSLSLSKDGLAQVSDAGHGIATISALSAHDAEGTPVPVNASVSGDTLQLSVERASSQYRYPIVVDPTVIDEKMWPEGETEFFNWGYKSTTGAAFSKVQEYSWVEIYGSGSYTAGQTAYFFYRTQKESHIYKVTGKTNEENSSAIKAEMSIASPGGEKNQVTLPTVGETSTTLCAKSGCETGTVNSTSQENDVYYQIIAQENSSSASVRSEFSNAAVYILQEKAPTASMDTVDATLYGKTNPLYAGTWANAKSYVGLNVFDRGTGSYKELLTSASKPGWSVWDEGEACAGVQCDECDETSCLSGFSKGGPVVFLLGTGLPDGEDTIQAEAEDAVGLKATASAIKLKFDNTAPHNIELSGLPSSHEIGETAYRLRATASDGSGSVPSSGVASIALKVDGVEVGKSSGACSPGPCTATSMEWTVKGSEFAAGQHTFSVVATDAAGNVGTENITVTVHHAAPLSMGPAAVDPVTGEARLSATDVSVAAPPTSLGITRSYNSEHLNIGANGPLGPQWSMSLSGQSSLVENAERAMVLTSAGGSQIVFTNSSGKFKAPAGDSNMTLTEKYISSKRAFVLSNISTGSSTTFTLPSGITSTWMPTIQEGPVPTETITFSYKSVEVGGVKVIQPEEALAPVPSKVSCSPELKRGCRALTFNYATSTTATGNNPSEWGDYNGHLTRVYMTAWDPSKAEMKTTTIAQYSYDVKGRLRAEWDPRVSPALKTLYGYDSEGHVTAEAAAGQQPTLLTYGLNAGDSVTGRLVSSSRPAASTALGEGIAPTNTSAPTLSTSAVTIGKSVSAAIGTWSSSPLAYAYQWERCASGGSSCTPIYGARNSSYLPTLADAGYALVAQVTATNAGGSVTASSSASEIVPGVTPTSTLQFGTAGTGNGQFKQPTDAAFDASANMWITDEANNRIEEFSPSGEFLHAYGSLGTENGQFKGAWGIAVEQSTGNVFVSDLSNCRVQELSSSGSFVRAFGSCGSGAGQLSNPCGVALDPEGNVWVADFSNNRLEEFSNTGAYIRTVGSAGTGNGQLKSPRNIAFAGSNMYVTDMGNNRVEEFSAEGTYVAQFGSEGTGNGQFSAPMGIAADPLSGDLYVADDNNSRVQQFTSTGTFVTKFGSAGTEAAQLKNPLGVAVSPSGTVIVMDNGNSRVSQWWPTPSPIYGMSMGSLGSGNGQLNKPIDEAVDPMGNVWVTDSSNNRIEKFSPYGAFLGAYGSFGTGHGQFNSPGGIAINQATGNVYVTDQKNGRIEEFSPAGEYLAEFGKGGSGSGEFSNPYGVAIDSSGNIWVADLYNGRVQELSQSGTTFSVVRIVGKKGTGNGEFVEPLYVAFDGGNAYVTDSGNNRVQEFSSTGTYIAQFGTKGTGNGQFETPEGIASDPTTGTLYVADTGKNRVEAFSAKGVFLTAFGSAGTGEGQFKAPVGLAFSPTGTLFVDDYGNNRIVKGTAGNVQTEAPAPPSAGTTAVTSIAYKVPVSGAGAPYPMSGTEVSAWGQEDDPSDAAAVFPPDEPQTSPPSDYRRATVYYLDSLDRVVNEVVPGGGTTTTEYNSYNDVTRTLNAANRAAALKEGAKSAETARLLDTQSTYGSEGAELLSTLGPRHTIKLASGVEKQARHHVVYSYDESAPSEGGPYRLVTKVTDGAQIEGEAEADVRTTVTSYAGQNGLGWILRKPTSTTTDPSGLKLVHTTIYDPATGNVTETRTPGAGAASETTPTGFLSQWGSLGSGNGQFSKPSATAVDSEGNVWVADTTNNRVQEFSSAGTYVRQISTGLSKPEGITVDSEKNVWVADTGEKLVKEYSSTGTLLKQYGASGELAFLFTTPDGIAVSAEGEKLVYVADRSSDIIYIFSPYGEGFRMGTIGFEGTGNGLLKEPRQLSFDSEGNLWVADAGNNRVQEFNSSGTYRQQIGTVGTGNGQFSKPRGIAFDPEGHIWVSDTGNNRLQEFNSAGSYMRQIGSAGTGEGQMKEPGSIGIDSTSHIYVPDSSNNRIQRWISPGLLHESSGTGGTHGAQTIYYTGEANSTYPSCGGHAEWTNLACQVQPASQPNTSGVPNLPVTTYTYNMLDETEKATATVGTDTRTVTNTYDAAGRVTSTANSSTVGTALPTLKLEYSSETGALSKESTTSGEKTQTLTSVYNSLGELTSYADADGNTATYSYDIDGRVESSNDGKGTQTYVYDSTTGLQLKLIDSAAGTFTATYDSGDNIKSIAYPNAMSANYTLDPTGQLTGVQYVKTAHCASSCPETWFSNTVLPSVHGQWLSQASNLSSQAYTYDAAGRLTKAQETPTGKGCITRIYAYDEETNRLSVTTREPNGEGGCATEGGTTENHSYDPANRLIDAGTTYDSFGNTTSVSATDAGGHELTSAFYDDNRLASQTQNGETLGYQLDPAGRPREIVSTGKVVATEVNHFDSPASEPAWTGELSAQWTRDIKGFGGGLVAIQHNGETPVLQLLNLHGDIVATASDSETATTLSSTIAEATPYGVPATEAPPKYSWLGAHELATQLSSGVLLMGVRSYVPQLGRFLQTDPVPGGSANAYAYTYGDPVNSSDPTGAYTATTQAFEEEYTATQANTAVEVRAAEIRAAEEAAARAEAERKAAEAAEEAGYSLGSEGSEEELYEEGGEEGEEYASLKSKAGVSGFQIGDAIEFLSGIGSSESEMSAGEVEGNGAMKLRDVRRRSCVFSANGCHLFIRMRTPHPRLQCRPTYRRGEYAEPATGFRPLRPGECLACDAYAESHRLQQENYVERGDQSHLEGAWRNGGESEAP